MESDQSGLKINLHIMVNFIEGISLIWDSITRPRLVRMSHKVWDSGINMRNKIFKKPSLFKRCNIDTFMEN
jgi:hypothetical protein